MEPIIFAPVSFVRNVKSHSLRFFLRMLNIECFVSSGIFSTYGKPTCSCICPAFKETAKNATIGRHYSFVIKLISPLDWGGEGKNRDFSFALFCSNAFYLCRRCALVRTVRTGGGNVFSRPQRTKRPLRPRTRDGEGKEREGVLGEHCRVHREHTRGERGECR